MKPTGKKLFRWGVISLVGLVGLLAIFYAEENWRGERALNNFKRAWEAKGESFDFKDFIPKSVPDDQNFALTPIVATCYEGVLDKQGHELKPHRTNVIQRLMMNVYHYPPGDTVSGVRSTNGDWRIGKMCDLQSWQIYYRTPFTNMFLFVEDTPAGKATYWKPFTNSGSILTNDFAFPPKPGSPAADVLLALGKYDSDIEELRAASRLTNSRFPLNYDAKLPSVVYLMHLAPLKYCSQTLQLRAIAELENGESQKALDDVMLMLRLVDSIRTEPFAHSQFWRSEMANLIVQVVWEGLARHRWSDVQLAAIERELGRLDFLADYQLVMRCDRIGLFTQLEQLRRTRNFEAFRRNGWTQSNGFKPLPEFLFHIAPDALFYRIELDCAKQFQEWALPMVNIEKKVVSLQMLTNQEIAFQKAEQYRSPYNTFTKFSPNAYYARKFVYTQSTIDLARVACALESYRLAHGAHPESLGKLVPEFISQVPHDIIGGQPLHYRRTTKDRFVLYSVGWDNTDDGGVVALSKTSHWDDTKHKWVVDPDDWVWKN